VLSRGISIIELLKSIPKPISWCRIGFAWTERLGSHLCLLAYVTVFLLKQSDFSVNASRSLQPSRPLATFAALAHPSMPHWLKISSSVQRYRGKINIPTKIVAEIGQVSPSRNVSQTTSASRSNFRRCRGASTFPHIAACTVYSAQCTVMVANIVIEIQMYNKIFTI